MLFDMFVSVLQLQMVSSEKKGYAKMDVFWTYEFPKMSISRYDIHHFQTDASNTCCESVASCQHTKRSEGQPTRQHRYRHPRHQVALVFSGQILEGSESMMGWHVCIGFSNLGTSVSLFVYSVDSYMVILLGFGFLGCSSKDVTMCCFYVFLCPLGTNLPKHWSPWSPFIILHP